jgi:hypothetical protein
MADNDAIRERAIQAAIHEMASFSGNLGMKVRKAIDRYEFVMELGKAETLATS